MTKKWIQVDSRDLDDYRLQITGDFTDHMNPSTVIVRPVKATRKEMLEIAETEGLEKAKSIVADPFYMYQVGAIVPKGNRKIAKLILDALNSNT